MTNFSNYFFFAILLFSPLFANSQLNSGLVAYFEMNGTINDNTNSIISSSNGSISYTSDRNGNMNGAVELDGSTSIISFNEANVKTSFPVTISAWVNVNSFTDYNRIFFSDNDYGNNAGYWLSIDGSTGTISAGFGGNIGGVGPDSRRTFNTDNAISTNNWHHIVAIIRDYNDMSIYLNCISQNGSYNGTGPTSVSYSNTESRIGSYIGNSSNPDGWFFDGEIDEVAIWNRELTQNEITTLCNSSNYLSINEEENNKLKVYPNPASNSITIDLSDFNNNSKISIIDARGRIVKALGVVTSSHLDISIDGLEAGIYSIIISEEKKHYNKLFVVQ